MKIADIKDQTLRELAIKRYLEQCEIADINWWDTPEGNQFWVKVNQGDITELPKEMELLGNDIQTMPNCENEYHRANIAAIMLIAIINSKSTFTEGLGNNMYDAVYLADALLNQLKKQ